ncbi:LysR substrate-binding domain-containing protein [Rhodospirillaceae bacterium SYSU D60014]|uniref:LysR substrate-binding domain-containing protein n=1 Tax=Virgifigura deserti TaxID=2268457 RepID=UPI000E66440B
MAKSDRQLPPLPSLVPFEFAARLGSMSAAARELGISQPAVSRHLAQLEADLGQALFQRTRRGLRLTEAGRTYQDAVAHGLDHIAQATRRLRHSDGGRTIRITAHFGFTHQWLIPRLPLLRATVPDLFLRLITDDREEDLDVAGCDIAIRFGTGDWPDCEATKLLTEEVFPICSPSYLRDRQRLQRHDLTPFDLLEEGLLHMDEVSDRWFTWSSWFAAQGVTAELERPRLFYAIYPLLLQATLAGEGIALGWRGLTDELIAQNRLVQLLPAVRRSDRGYFLCRPKHSSGTRTKERLIRRVSDWIISAAGEPPGTANS